MADDQVPHSLCNLRQRFATLQAVRPTGDFLLFSAKINVCQPIPPLGSSDHNRVNAFARRPPVQSQQKPQPISLKTIKKVITARNCRVLRSLCKIFVQS